MDNENSAVVSVDMGGIIAAAAAAGMSASVSISLFPRDDSAPGPDVDVVQRMIGGEEDRISGPRPIIPGKFMLGEMVNYVAGVGANSRSLVGEVRGITHYMDREPAYLIRPDEQDQEQLGHDHDVWRDEDELGAI